MCALHFKISRNMVPH